MRNHGAVLGHAAAQLAQRVQHDARVVRIQQVVHGGGALHRAASSSTRLEMLLEPGSVTVPPALARGGMSRNAVANIG
jgi:hypothetical protein